MRRDGALHYGRGKISQIVVVCAEIVGGRPHANEIGGAKVVSRYVDREVLETLPYLTREKNGHKAYLLLPEDFPAVFSVLENRAGWNYNTWEDWVMSYYRVQRPAGDDRGDNVYLFDALDDEFVVLN